MRIKVISKFEGECLYRDAFFKTVHKYCNKFGYDFIFDHQSKPKNAGPNWYWWNKANHIADNLKDCDWLLWIDADTICINFQKRIEDIIGDFDVLLTKEDVIQSGVMLLRNSEWTKSFVQKWLNYSDEHTTKTGSDNVNNDQECLRRILDTDPPAASHFKFVSNTDFVVKHVHFFEKTNETMFVHFPGCEIADKVRLMKQYSERFDWREDSYASFVNMDHRADRLGHMSKQLARIGLKAERTRGIKPSEVAQPAHKISVMQNRTPGAIGCHYSQVSIIEKAHSLGKSALVMEDDLVFCSDFNERMDYAENFLNSTEWDVLWLGGTYHKQATWHRTRSGKHTNPDLPQCHCRLDKDWEPTSDKRIVRTYGCWSTYGYLVNYKSIPRILDLLDQNVYQSMGIDWLFIFLQPNLKTFAFLPGMVKQYDNQSDIGNGITYFSHSKGLGPHWYQDKMTDYRI
jgi:GR25 family glycosyltransferase involved in LPS biosynthesis